MKSLKQFINEKILINKQIYDLYTKELMKDVKTSVEDYMEKMKKKSCTCNSKGNAIEEESFKSDKEVFKLAQDIFDDIQSIDVEELSSEYKKVFSKIKKSILSILELGN